jgi:hypothetical protein
LGVRQLLLQIRVLLLESLNFLRLTQGNAALQGNIFMQLIVQRLLFL